MTGINYFTHEVRRLRPIRAVPTSDPSPAPHPPTHLPAVAPANFALPEKRRKGDTR